MPAAPISRGVDLLQKHGFYLCATTAMPEKQYRQAFYIYIDRCQNALVINAKRSPSTFFLILETD